MLRHAPRRARRRRPPRPLALTLTLALCAASTAARAQCRVVPGEEGEVAAWSVAAWSAGPSPRANVGAALGALLDSVARRGVEWSALHPSASAALGWRARSSPHAWIDLGAGARRGGARVAVASLALRARTAGDRWLFVGADDALSVRLDGVERHRVARPRASREDDDAVRLPLSVGEHTLTLVVASRGELDLYARITDARFRPDPDLSLSIEGAAATDCERLFVDGVALDVARAADPGGARVTLTASFPGGSVEAPRATNVSISDGATSLASSPVAFGASMAPVELSTVTRAARVTVSAGGATRDVRVAIPSSVSASLLRAREVLRRLDPRFDAPPSPLPYPAPPLPAGVPVASLWSVEGVAERLASLVREADPDASHLADEAATLASLVDDLDAGRDPYAHRTGALRRAYRSPLDGALQPYSVFVPPSFRRDRPWPLIVGLHGLHGSAHRMLPVLVGLYDESEDRSHAERHLPALPDVGAILAAPWGYGDSGYRQQGEYDVLRVVDEVTAAYGADPDRTYLTGLSMGGIGAAGVALHNPDRFAAMAPLCGYHSYFVRGDTRGARRPWELAQMELRSNDHWAENALHTPMYLVHGTLDRPTANSQVLVDRFRALDYRAEVEWPALGHNVWGQTYANGRIVPYFARFRRETAPRRVRFRTPDLHWNSSWWVTVDALATPDGRLAAAGLWERST
ncbi:MAG: alpha/beta hydrolase-fold protein [Polyangiales bacterium]